MNDEGTISSHLERIGQEYLERVEFLDGGLPKVPYEAAWQSPCIVSHDDLNEQVYWRPLKRQSRVDFSGLESALELKFPDQFVEFFSAFWSASLPVIWHDRKFQLLQLWNEEDQQNLLHNMLGHVFETRRVRQPETLFFGLIDDDRFLTCDVATRAVMLEELSGERPQQVADNLLELLQQLSGHYAPEAES